MRRAGVGLACEPRMLLSGLSSLAASKRRGTGLGLVGLFFGSLRLRLNWENLTSLVPDFPTATRKLGFGSIGNEDVRHSELCGLGDDVENMLTSKTRSRHLTWNCGIQNSGKQVVVFRRTELGICT